MVYMAYDKDQTGPAGIASGGVVCDTTANIQKEKQSISEWFSNTTIFAWVIFIFKKTYAVLLDPENNEKFLCRWGY